MTEASAVKFMDSPDGKAPTMTAERLRGLCHEYYVVQQGLQSAEDDTVGLEVMLSSLESQVASKRKQLFDAKEELGDLNVHLAASRAPLVEGDATVIAHGKHLQTSLAVTDAALQDTLRRNAELHQTIDEEGKATVLLEGALKNHVDYNNSLVQQNNELLREIEGVGQRRVGVTARIDRLDRERTQASKAEKLNDAAHRTRELSRKRLLEALRDADTEATRLRRDKAFAERVALTEDENAREQELVLEQLLQENRRLKALLSGLPEAVPLEESEVDPVTAAMSPGGTATAMPVEERVPRRAAASTVRPGARIVDKYRQHNLALMQQMVNTMEVIKQYSEENGKKKAAAAAAVAAADRK